MRKKRKPKKLSTFWIKFEHYNSKLITPAIVILLVIILYELFLHVESQIATYIVYALDYFVLAVFIVDLIFLAIRARSVKFFFKKYWLDIIAVIPLILVFTIVGRIYRIFTAAESVTLGQSILHESLEVRKGISAVARSNRFVKYFRIVVRGIRVITKSKFFTKLSDHVNRKNKKQLKRKRV